MSIIGLITLVLGIIVMFIFVVYVFVGIISLPFYFLGFIFKILYFPITLIDQFVYPVGTLPYLALTASIFFLFAHLFINNTKQILSLKPNKKSSSKK